MLGHRHGGVGGLASQQRRRIRGGHHHHGPGQAVGAEIVLDELAHFAAALAHQCQHGHVAFRCCGASMDSSVDLPTPEPANRPSRWPVRQVVKQLSTRTPRSIGGPSRARVMAGRGGANIPGGASFRPRVGRLAEPIDAGRRADRSPGRASRRTVHQRRAMPDSRAAGATRCRRAHEAWSIRCTRAQPLGLPERCGVSARPPLAPPTPTISARTVSPASVQTDTRSPMRQKTRQAGDLDRRAALPTVVTRSRNANRRNSRQRGTRGRPVQI